MPQNRQESVLMISQLGWLSPGVSCGGFSHEMKPRLSFSAGNPNSDGGDQWLCSWWSRASTVWRSGGPCLYPGQDGTDQTSTGVKYSLCNSSELGEGQCKYKCNHGCFCWVNTERPRHSCFQGTFHDCGLTQLDLDSFCAFCLFGNADYTLRTHSIRGPPQFVKS